MLVYSTDFSEFFISSFVSLYSLNTFFIETKSSWVIYESIKALETRASIVSNIVFPSNTILSSSFLFFLIIDLYFLIPVVITQSFFVAPELVIPAGIPTNEENGKILTQAVTVEVFN